MTPERTRLLVLQGTSYCNLSCTYCYLPAEARARHSRMDLDIVRQAARLLRPNVDPAGALTVLWHAGEPLAQRVAYYEDAIAILKEELPGRLQFNMQTNAVGLDRRWCEFFVRHGVFVGVSIDGPRAVHDACRLTRRGTGSFDLVMKGVEALKGAGVPFSTISVVTRHSLGRADEIASFLLDLEPVSCGFNVEEVEGAHADSSLAGLETGVREFVRSVYATAAARGQVTRIREFKHVLGRLAAGGEGDPRSGENLPFRIVTVAADGGVGTFSPELMSLASENARLRAGDVSAALMDLVAEPKVLELAREIEAGVENCRASCRYFQFCGGGSPSNKLIEHGRLDATETMHCRLHRQVFADTVLSALAQTDQLAEA